MTRVVRTRADLRAARDGLPGPVGLVPTMGALHAGHRALLAAARSSSGSVVTSVFVNPLQFGPGEDLDRYPRSWEDDLAMCEAEGVDLVFAPDVAEMYPHGEPAVRVVSGPVGARFEGASRPGHFDGVLTVVTKLFQLVRPQRTFFGEKDAQQLALVSLLARDLDFAVEVVGVPTVREPDGLALSSRNVYLSPTERRSALALSRALTEAASAAPGGVSNALAAGRAVLDAAPGVAVDYFAAVTPEFAPVPATGFAGPARLVVAARVGKTRLIDNVAVVF